MKTAAELIVDTLIKWNVKCVFGIPGDGVNGIMEALRRRKNEIKFIQVRHEESAALMATGYAKYTGEIGVCLASSGPGGLHLINGLYDAKMDGQAVVAITGMQYHDLMGTRTQQDVELDKVFADVAVYNQRVSSPEHAVNATDLACRSAKMHGGPAHITIPSDIQSKKMSLSEVSERNQFPQSIGDISRGKIIPQQTDIERAVERINQGKKIAILAGQGAKNAREELIKLSDKLAAPIAKALLGKDVLPDDLPNTTGTLGLLGTSPSEYIMGECDTLILVGTSFPYSDYLPNRPDVVSIQIDWDESKIGLRMPVDVGLVGDAKETLSRLVTQVKENKSKDFYERTMKVKDEWMKTLVGRSSRRESPIKPQFLAHEIGQLLDADAIVSCDSGTVTTWWSRYIPVKQNQMHSVSGHLSTMACALPYAIAAKVAFPERQSIAFVGDGGFSMLLSEFLTCVKYDLDVKVFVVNNGTLGQIKWEQIALEGNPEYECELQSMDFVKFADACSAKGYLIEEADECADTIAEALSKPGPVIVDARVDANEPPLPAHINFAQSKNFISSLLKGTKKGGKILKESLKTKSI